MTKMCQKRHWQGWTTTSNRRPSTRCRPACQHKLQQPPADSSSKASPKAGGAATRGAPAAAPVTGAEEATRASPGGDARPAIGDHGYHRGDGEGATQLKPGACVPVARAAAPPNGCRRKMAPRPDPARGGPDPMKGRPDLAPPAGGRRPAGVKKKKNQRRRPRLVGWGKEKVEGGKEASRADFGRAAGRRRRPAGSGGGRRWTGGEGNGRRGDSPPSRLEDDAGQKIE